jgi:colanic acid biosynthesis glycosyl transferase WcaI
LRPAGEIRAHRVLSLAHRRGEEALPFAASRGVMNDVAAQRPLQVLILTHHFPPEVSAGASRFHELARAWAEAGHQVTVVTCAPNHPTGVLFPGYRNRAWQEETIDGIKVVRLWTFLAPNRGYLRRILAYATYPLATTLAAPFLPAADVLISTTPHFFCGLAGYPASRLRRVPWVLDIRDLWPESIIAVDALQPGFWLWLLKVVERFCYRRAAHIVSASDAFRSHFVHCGIRPNKVAVVTNGVDLNLFAADIAAADRERFRERHGLSGKFVAAYVGTHGLAHQLEVILEAADRLRARSDIAFVLAGDGAERERLVAQCRAMALTNVMMLPLMPRAETPELWAASDAGVVTLRPAPLFELVIPSKMFEAMAMRKPVILGVRGEARRIVESGDCGLTFAPGDAAALAARVTALADDPALAQRLGENGYRLATAQYDRQVLANRYLAVLQRVAGASRAAQSIRRSRV